jgi:hypothetical protein
VENRIFGSVIDFDDPKLSGLQGITVVAEGEGQRLKTVTGKLGQYRFTGVTPGKYKIPAVAHARQRSSPIDVYGTSDYVEILIEPRSYSELDFWIEATKSQK